MRKLCAVVLCALASLAIADAELVLDSFAFIEVPKGDRTVKQPVEFVDPGDIVLMELHISNIGSSAANNFEVDNPIADFTTLYQLPEARFDPFVGNANGQFFPIAQLQGQRLDQITQLKWTVPSLAAGEQLILQFRVRVNSP